MPFTKNMQIRIFYDNKGWESLRWDFHPFVIRQAAHVSNGYSPEFTR